MKRSVKKGKKRRRENHIYTKDFKLQAVERVLKGERITTVSRKLDMNRGLLYYWLQKYSKEDVAKMGQPPIEEESPERQIAALQRKVGQQELELDFLKRAFERVKELRQSNTGSGGSASTERSGK